MIKKEEEKFSPLNFLSNFSVIKTLDLDWIRIRIGIQPTGSSLLDDFQVPLPPEGSVRGAGGEVPRGAGEGDPQGYRQPRLLQVHQPRRHCAGQVHSLQIIIIVRIRIRAFLMAGVYTQTQVFVFLPQLTIFSLFHFFWP